MNGITCMNINDKMFIRNLNILINFIYDYVKNMFIKCRLIVL